MTPASDPELALLVACAGWPPSEPRASAVRDAAGTGINWDRFGRVVGRHRMAGMAVNGLAAAGIQPPPDSGRRLRQAAQADLVQALATAREAVRLVERLATAGIAVTVLKGPPLAALIYGTLAVRQVRDLDLLVSAGDLAHALQIVREQGYQLVYEGGDKRLRPDRSAMLKDVELFHPTSGILIELHGRLSENAELLPVVIAQAVGPVAIAPGLSVPALTGRPLLLYLMVHGFRHGWYRLKWLADVSAIVADLSPTELVDFVADTERHQLHIVSLSTLLVLNALMGTPLPPAVERAAKHSRRARFCAGLALRHLRDEREPDKHMVLRIVRAATMFLARPTWPYLRQEAARLLVDQPFVLRFGGGRTVTALSIGLRPVLWSVRKADTVLRGIHAGRGKP